MTSPISRVPLVLLPLLITACNSDSASVGAFTVTLTDGAGDGTDDDDVGDTDGNESSLDLGGETGEVPPNCEEAAEQQTNQGCEFWAVDLPQPWYTSQGQAGVSPQDGPFAVVVANASSNLDAEIEIYLGATATLVDSASVSVGAVHVFQLPALSIEAQASTTGGEAYRIVSSVPITTYQFNTLDQSDARFSADASLLFPTHVLRNDYTTFTGDAVAGPQGDQGAFISVVGVEDATTVTVYPTATVMPGAPTQDVVIDRGEVYTLISESLGGSPVAGEGNLSGSRIVADKPVAVFSGNVAAGEPVAENGIWTCCADHLEHQMLPLEAWGDSYLMAPPVQPSGFEEGNSIAAYRIVGGEDGIVLTYSPVTPEGAPTVIDAYEVAYFLSDQAFSVQGSKPFGVAQFLVGSSWNFSEDGDPAMVVLPAQDQLRDNYVFIVPPTYTSNYASVVRPVGSSTSLDGVSVTAPTSPAGTIGGNEYEFMQVPVGEGGHRISGDEPFEILVYGYALTASYAYPGGSGLEFISQPPPPPVP